MTSNIISIDETGIVVLRIDCTFWQLVVPICTQLIWESDEPGNLNILGNLFGSQHQIDCSEELMMDGYPDQPFNRVIGWTNNRGIDRLCERSDWLDNTRTICQSDRSDWFDHIERYTLWSEIINRNNRTEQSYYQIDHIIWTTEFIYIYK